MLIDIPSEKIESFIEVLRKELPQSFFVINLIETSRKWKLKNKELQISLLYTADSMKTGVFVGILKSGCQHPIVSTYALDSYENALEEELKQVFTDLKGDFFIEGVTDKHAPIIDNLITNQSLKVKRIGNIIALRMPIEEALNLNIECPDGVELAPLSDHHIDEIYEIWRRKDMFTKTFLKYCLLYNDEAAHGMFSKTTGELLARCVKSYSGFLAALQTVEKARNKGYAKLLLKYVAKKMAEKGYQPCVYVAVHNLSSLSAMYSAGYRDVCKIRNYTVVKD